MRATSITYTTYTHEHLNPEPGSANHMNIRVTKRLRPVRMQSQYRVSSGGHFVSGNNLTSCLDKVGRPGWHRFISESLAVLETGAVGKSEVKLEFEII